MVMEPEDTDNPANLLPFARKQKGLEDYLRFYARPDATDEKNGLDNVVVGRGIGLTAGVGSRDGNDLFLAGLFDQIPGHNVIDMFVTADGCEIKQVSGYGTAAPGSRETERHETRYRIIPRQAGEVRVQIEFRLCGDVLHRTEVAFKAFAPTRSHTLHQPKLASSGHLSIVPKEP